MNLHEDQCPHECEPGRCVRRNRFWIWIASSVATWLALGLIVAAELALLVWLTT